MKTRIIRLDYRFTYEGRVYEAQGFDAGETESPMITENENRVSAVCHALDIDGDEFMERYDADFWCWTDADWKAAGFEFEYCEEAFRR